ncbi:MAG: hypothetical protein JOZ46_02675 [Candidatus Dormibacteraeota bacterium]|nr:hypothetical protein [Candidatus Dormibacteraeota bacterium]MBV9524703.1 hypothetical protein [Candidatus Dormibacteraeota bacterium]
MQGAPQDRAAFTERIRLQLRARYRGVEVDTDDARFALHVTAPGIDTTLPLAPLHTAIAREPARAAALIAEYVASVERQLTPRSGLELSAKRLVWCVRSRAYLETLSRAGELARQDIATSMCAFVAEDLPGSIMRGVPRSEWEAAGLDDAAVRAVASDNTAERFARMVERIRGIERIPADGWRMAGDPLYQGSVLMAPAVLAALVERSGGDVLLGVPDRGVVLAVPAAMPNAERFQRRVTREYRESMNPCSHEVVRTDGRAIMAVPRSRPRAGAVVMPWLDE